ncbi:MAG: N-formylglutamate amidohydrolase [Rhizobiales bacterium]|nr:N-formylglutamate amidohydrolase [Hyphomicrobiales bacterium]
MPGESSGPPPFEVMAPRCQTLPLVFNSPHSGRHYPAAFLRASRLDSTTIRRSEDTFVEELFAPAVAHGSPLLKANFPRAWLDVNREPYELDPKMFDGSLPAYANVRSMRVAGGLGTIARIVSESEEIYSGPLCVEEGLARIDGVYKPYHRTLRELLLATRALFGFAFLVDCHSMPSSVRGAGGRLRPDFVLGDRYGTSCAGELTDALAHGLTRLGYSVSRNKPYAGGFITEHYGQPRGGLHAMQVEVNRALYMDEQSFEKSAGFARLAADLDRLIGDLAGEFAAGLLVRADAAE